MSKDDKEIKLSGAFQMKDGTQSPYRIRIIDGVAAIVFGDRRVARSQYEAERKTIKDIVYIDRQNCIMEKFPGKTKEEVFNIIGKQLAKWKVKK